MTPRARGEAGRLDVLRALADLSLASGQRLVPWVGGVMRTRFPRGTLGHRMSVLEELGLVRRWRGSKRSAALTLAGWLRVLPAPWPEAVSGFEVGGGRIHYLYESETEAA